MKIITQIYSLLLPALLLPRSVTAASTAELIAKLPTCALECLAVSVSASSCSSTDTACICSNNELQSAISACTLANCTILETLSARNTTSVICDEPLRNKGSIFSQTSTALGIITGVFVVARFVYRIFIARSGIGADDWVALAATIVGIPSSVLNIHGLAANGLGKDIWKLDTAEVYRFLKFFYVIEIHYFVDITLLKLTLLFFFLRIFPAQGVRRLIWGTIGFVCVWCLTFLFIGIFQCHPISYYWTNWDGLHSGSCLNVNAIGWANASISIALDIWMLAIPLWQLRKLRLHWKKKIGVSMMFVVGTFVTVVSILRLQSLLHFANSTNPTWDNYEVINWSTIEINVGIICACMPTLRLLLVHFFPRVLGSSSARYYYNSNGNGNSSAPNGSRGPGGGESRGAGNSRSRRSIPLVSMTSGHHQKGLTNTTITTINATDEEDNVGVLQGSESYRHENYNGNSTAGSNSLGVGGSQAPAAVGGRHGHSESVGGAGSGASGGIMYSKSYAVEYGTEYHDEARLVSGREQRLDSLSKSDLKSSRGSESSL